MINESIITHFFCCWSLTFSEKNEEKRGREKREKISQKIFFLPTAALGGPALFLYFIFFPILPRIFSERMSILHGSYFICVGDWTLTTVFRYFNLSVYGSVTLCQFSYIITTSHLFGCVMIQGPVICHLCLLFAL